MDAIYHALEWKRAVQAKTSTPTDTIESQLIETVIAFERTQAWMSIARSMMGIENSHALLVSEIEKHMPHEEANWLATTLLALGYAEATGTEITSEVFNKVFNIHL